MEIAEYSLDFVNIFGLFKVSEMFQNSLDLCRYSVDCPRNL